MNSPSSAFERILQIFRRLEIRYCVVGSVASSFYGTPRTTMDIDLVADLRADQLGTLAGELSAEFYADLEMMKDAWSHGRAFNAIHLASSYRSTFFRSAMTSIARKLSAAAARPKPRVPAANRWSASSRPPKTPS